MKSFKVLRKTVTTAGTPIQLGTNVRVPDGVMLVIKAMTTNTGTIGVGPTAFYANLNNNECFRLSAGQSVSIDVDQLDDVWIDSSQNGEGVELLWEVQFEPGD